MMFHCSLYLADRSGTQYSLLMLLTNLLQDSMFCACCDAFLLSTVVNSDYMSHANQSGHFPLSDLCPTRAFLTSLSQFLISQYQNRNVNAANRFPKKKKKLECDSDLLSVFAACGNLYAAGGNNEGQLGLGDFKERPSFQLVEFFIKHGPIKMLAAGSNTSAAITRERERLNNVVIT